MRQKAGVVFSVVADNPPVPGCTISTDVYSDANFSVMHFSLAEGTDISPEMYTVHKLWLVASGRLQAFATDADNQRINEWSLTANDCLLTPVDTPIGVEAPEDAIYTEITCGKDTIMNKAITAGEVFALKDLVPYQEGRIVNMDVAHNDSFKLAVMAFDEGTGLSEHAAPGDALVFALDGNGIIGYEGEEHHISAGQNFKFDKGGRHYVKADGRFTMALLVQLA